MIAIAGFEQFPFSTKATGTSIFGGLEIAQSPRHANLLLRPFTQNLSPFLFSDLYGLKIPKKESSIETRRNSQMSIILLSGRIKILKSLLSTSPKFSYPKFWILVTDPKSENYHLYPTTTTRKFKIRPIPMIYNSGWIICVFHFWSSFMIFAFWFLLLLLSSFTVNFMAQIL